MVLEYCKAYVESILSDCRMLSQRIVESFPIESYIHRLFIVRMINSSVIISVMSNYNKLIQYLVSYVIGIIL